MIITESLFEKRLKEANDKQSLAQLAEDVLERSLNNKSQAKLLYNRFEKMLDKGLNINTVVDETSCISLIQYGYTDYHLKTARLIFDRCGLPSVKEDGEETMLEWIESKVMYNYYNEDFTVKLYLLCLSYKEGENETVKMNKNLYPEMFNNGIQYTSTLDLREGIIPLDLDYTIFRNFENIDFCVEMIEQVKGYYGCWKMHIFDKKTKLELAVLS